MQSAITAIVSGRVQMVLMRDFTRRMARSLGVVGEVENLHDGTVRVRAEGERSHLESLIVALHRGSFFAHVDDVAVEWREPTGEFTSFVIRYR